MVDYVIGEYAYNIDNKGRLIIPAKFKEFLGDPFVVTKGLDGCLFVFPMSEWRDFEKKLSGLPVADKDARAFTRFFFAGAAECSPDKQGRMMIPPTLRRFAGLEKETIVVGVTNRIEIWNAAKWEAYNGQDAMAFADKMGELGI